MSSLVQTALGPVEYADSGTGYPLLSFHGTPGGWDAALLAPSMQIFREMRIIGLSRPGYLRTPLEPCADVNGQADLAAALLDVLGIEKVAVYGLSGGGPYALAFAIRHSDRCRRLALVAAVTRRDPRPKWQLDGELALLSAADLLGWLPRFLPAWEFVKIARVVFPFGPRKAGYRNDVQVFNTLPELAVEWITCPTLLIHGTRDRNASFPHARETAGRIRNCKTVFLERAGHLGAIQSLEAKFALADFLSRA